MESFRSWLAVLLKAVFAYFTEAARTPATAVREAAERDDREQSPQPPRRREPVDAQENIIAGRLAPDGVCTCTDKAAQDLLSLLEDLPLHIQKYIYSLILFPQPKALQNDIVSFHCVRNRLFEIYWQVCYNYDGGSEEDVYGWLANDLERFLNDDVPAMYGLTENNYKKCLRLRCLKTRHDVDKFVFQNRGENNGVNRCLGLFTPDERDDFLLIARKWVAGEADVDDRVLYILPNWNRHGGYIIE